MALMSKAGLNDTKTRHDYIHAWTRGRTESSKELFDNEMDDLIWKLENDFAFASNPERAVQAITEMAMREKRSIVLAIAQRVGIHEGTSFTKFNAWMKKCSVLKKDLRHYTYDELCNQLVPQMHKLEANYRASAEKAGTKAWYHHYNIPETGEN